MTSVNNPYTLNNQGLFPSEIVEKSFSAGRKQYFTPSHFIKRNFKKLGQLEQPSIRGTPDEKLPFLTSPCKKSPFPFHPSLFTLFCIFSGNPQLQEEVSFEIPSESKANLQWQIPFDAPILSIFTTNILDRTSREIYKSYDLSDIERILKHKMKPQNRHFWEIRILLQNVKSKNLTLLNA